MSIYYKIWADAIYTERGKKGRQGSWQVFSITFMSILMGINLLAVLLLFRLLSGGRYLLLFPVHLLRYVGLNTGISVLITYVFPFVILNYLLLFYNNKYNEVIKTYGNSGGKLYRNYALISIAIILIPLLLKLMFL